MGNIQSINYSPLSNPEFIRSYPDDTIYEFDKKETLLSKMVRNTAIYPKLIDDISLYLKLYPNKINEIVKGNETLLMIAVNRTSSTSTLETVVRLIAAGANLDIQTNWAPNHPECGVRETALTLAIKNMNTTSSPETVELLIKSGANVNIQVSYKETALTRIVRENLNNNSYQIMKLLIEHGADVNHQCKMPTLTPLSIILQRSKSELTNKAVIRFVNYLTSHGAIINIDKEKERKLVIRLIQRTDALHITHLQRFISIGVIIHDKGKKVINIKQLLTILNKTAFWIDLNQLNKVLAEIDKKEEKSD